MPAGPLVGRVMRVVDGDTIKVRLGGRVERVRYIGMDTPESVKPGTPVQCFAKKASAENERLVAGREVRLVPDVEQRDRYGRLLAYVYPASGGPMVNEVLVRRGFSMLVATPYGPDWYRYLMRRLAERPANTFFFLKNLVRG